MKRDRAYRRHQLEKRKRWWVKHLKATWRIAEKAMGDDYEDYITHQANIRATTRKPCSCGICKAYDRKRDGLTVQERRNGTD